MDYDKLPMIEFAAQEVSTQGPSDGTERERLMAKDMLLLIAALRELQARDTMLTDANTRLRNDLERLGEQVVPKLETEIAELRAKLLHLQAHPLNEEIDKVIAELTADAEAELAKNGERVWDMNTRAVKIIEKLRAALKEGKHE